MIRYLTVGLVAVIILAGCQDNTVVTSCKGKILSMSYFRNGDAEIVFQTNDGKSHMYDYDFDTGQEQSYHVGQSITCYVDQDENIDEIAKN